MSEISSRSDAEIYLWLATTAIDHACRSGAVTSPDELRVWWFSEQPNRSRYGLSAEQEARLIAVCSERVAQLSGSIPEAPPEPDEDEALVESDAIESDEDSMSKYDSEKHGWILLDWDGSSFSAHANYDLEQITARLGAKATVRVQFAQQRSLPRHRLYWAVIRQVIKNNEFFATDKALHRTLLLGCGVVEPVLSPDGDIHMLPSSTAFDAMKEHEFKAYFDKAMELISTKILPGVDIRELLAEAKAEARWKDAA